MPVSNHTAGFVAGEQATVTDLNSAHYGRSGVIQTVGRRLVFVRIPGLHTDMPFLYWQLAQGPVGGWSEEADHVG